MKTAPLAPFLMLLLAACPGPDPDGPDGGTGALDPATAPRVTIDRFSDDAATTRRRSDNPALPAAGAAIDLDDFVIQGFGPGGQVVKYYDLDVQPAKAGSWYRLVDASGEPVAGQLPIVTAVPGEAGYSDFVRIIDVEAPADYVANTFTSYDALSAAALVRSSTDVILNRPLVPEGTTRSLRLNDEPLEAFPVWIDDEVAFAMAFDEHPLAVTGRGEAPLSPIYVAFNINPGETGGGPPSGLKTEDGTQTHNIASTIPGDLAYSPLWIVNVYDNAEFATVVDLGTASAATLVAPAVMNVNCPIAAVP